MKSIRRRGHPMRVRRMAAGVALVLWAGLVSAPPAAAAGGALPADAVQQAVDRSVAAAGATGITQSISVVDRRTGALIADRNDAASDHQCFIDLGRRAGGWARRTDPRAAS